jgi:hypothetical protein
MTYTALLVAFSPLLMAAMRRPSWTSEVTAAVAVLTVAVCYLTGRFCDGVALWPPSPELLAGFVTALTSQQAIYLLLKDTKFLQWLEAQ